MNKLDSRKTKKNNPCCHLATSSWSL